MLKFFKHHLETIAGVEIYPIISFIIFFLFFLGLTWWVIKADKKFVKHMRHLPFEDEQNSQQQ